MIVHWTATGRRAARILISLLIAAGIAVGIGACGSGSGSGSGSGGSDTVLGADEAIPTTPASEGGTFRLARSIEPETLNPIGCLCGNGSQQVMAQIYDTVVDFEPGSLEAKPGLAKSWDVSADNRTFTFHLREERFSDGSPVTSADVKYTLDQMNTPENPYYALYEGMDKVTTPDPSTVVVTLTQPTPNFPYYLGYPATSIVSKQALEEVGEEAYSQNPVGSGPFMLKRWVKGQVVELVPNPYYWREGEPHLDKVEMLYMPNDNTRVLALISGKVDAVDAVPFSQVDQVNASGEAEVLFQSSTAMYDIFFNNKETPLDETAVRQALNYATPLDQIREVVFQGRAEISNSILPKLKDWTDEVKPYPYDLKKAKELLAGSSTPDGFDLTLDITAGDSTSKQVAELLQEAWGEIGMNLQVRQSDVGSLTERLLAYDYQAFLLVVDTYTSDLPIQDQFAGQLFNSLDGALHNNTTWYDNPEAERLSERAVHAPDEATQREFFHRLQRVTMEDPMAVPLAYPPYRGAARDNVVGFQYVKSGWWRLEQVSLEK